LAVGTAKNPVIVGKQQPHSLFSYISTFRFRYGRDSAK